MSAARSLLPVLLVAVLAGTAGAAGSRTPVTLRFALEAYKQEFAPAEQAELARDAVKHLVALLQTNAGFLEFTDRPDQYALTVRLDYVGPAGATTWARETGFHVELTGPGVPPGTRKYVTFRTKTEFGALRPVSRMLEEIKLKLTDDHVRGPIRELLAQVPAARGGQVWNVAPNPGWVLSYRKADLCMGFDSTLLIANEVPTAAGMRPVKLQAHARMDFNPPGPTPESLRGRLFGEAADRDAFTREIGQADASRVSVTAVYVTDYRALLTCPPGGVE